MPRKGVITATVVVVVLVAIVHLFFLTLITIPGKGEEPTLLHGDRVVVNRWAYGYRVPFSSVFGYHRWGEGQVRRNEWVAFNAPDTLSTQCPDTSDLCVGICMALPGDTVWMGSHGKVSANCSHASGQIWPIVVPAKGESVQITPWNARLYALTISRHENEKVEVKGDSLYVNGQKVSAYVFRNNYHWMASGNEQNLNDSRTMGFVPASCLLGRLEMVLYSFDGWKPRWSRMCKTAL